MKAVLENLKQRSILHRKQVLKIKEYINDKYPLLNTSQKASVFANAVHQVVDESVSLFEEKSRMQIKSDVLKSAVAKEFFDINGYDVFEVCSKIKPKEDRDIDFFETLTEWLNQNQEIPVTLEETKELQQIVIESAVATVVDILEESVNENRLAVESKPLTDLFEEDDDLLPFVEGEDVLSNPANIEAILAGGIYNNELFEDEPIEDIQENEIIDLGEVVETSDEPIWEEETIEIHPRKVERISGYEIKPPEVEDPLQRSYWQDQLKYIIPFAIVALIIIALLVSAGISALNENKVLDNNPEEIGLEETGSDQKEVDLDQSNAYVLPVVRQATPMVEINLANEEEGGHLADELKYHAIDKRVIKAYLIGKNSLLADDIYMDQFIQVGKDYNVNPLLLIAITGQEQGFVPEGQEYADQILNNPFNVYGSWKRFNTDFEEACKIAARTVLTSSEGRPKDYDPIKWINNTYAEDIEWNVGVRFFFEEMTLLLNE